MAKKREKPVTSTDLDTLADELVAAGDRDLIQRRCVEVEEALARAGLTDEHRNYVEIGRAKKQNFASQFSRSLAQKVADALRPRLKGILPDEIGRGQESRSGSASGLKRLDVNYSNPTIGLGLGVSIKTLNFRDAASRRYTKNMRRIDGELRAEAQDYHTRQPYSVLAALVFLPEDAAFDGAGGRSSFRHACDVFAGRTGRTGPDANASLFERVWVCLYGSDPASHGRLRCYDPSEPMPPDGIPDRAARLSEVIATTESLYAARNRAKR